MKEDFRQPGLNPPVLAFLVLFYLFLPGLILLVSYFSFFFPILFIPTEVRSSGSDSFLSSFTSTRV